MTPENVPEAKEINEAMYDEVIQDNLKSVSIATPLPPPSSVGEAQAMAPPPPPPPLPESTILPLYASVDKSRKKSKSPQPPDVPTEAPNMEIALYSNVNAVDTSLYDRLERDVQPQQGAAEPEYDIVNL